MRANGGDYSIYFWVRPTESTDALDVNGRFRPHVGFYQRLSPAFEVRPRPVRAPSPHTHHRLVNVPLTECLRVSPTQVLLVDGIHQATITSGRVEFFSTCAFTYSARVQAYQLDGGLTQDGWTLIVVTRTNTTDPTRITFGQDADRVYEPGVEKTVPWPQVRSAPPRAPSTGEMCRLM